MILVDRLITTMVPMAIVVMVGISIVQGVAIIVVGPLAIGVKIVVTLVEIKEIEVEVEIGMIPAQVSEGLE